jgi:TetR/AcrR family transcriptional regulator
MESKVENVEIREKIMRAARGLFAERGLEGVSVREIATTAGVNIAMVSYYFGGKEGLYFDCISEFAKSKQAAVKNSLKPMKNAEDFKRNLKAIVEDKMNSFTEDLEAHKIIMRELQSRREPEFQKKIMKQLVPVFDLMNGLFVDAKKMNLLKEEMEPEHLTLMLMGTMSHPCIAEHAMETHLGYNMTNPKQRDIYINQICLLFFSGVLK